MTHALFDRAPMAGQASLASGFPAPEQAAPEESAFVCLTLDGQLCGIDVMAVRDILGVQTFARIPLAPREIAGSLNLRGRIVTALDLRRRLKLPNPAVGAERLSVVVEQAGELFALLVDQVSEVMTLRADQFERSPLTLPPAWATVSTGVYRLPDGLMAVLDVPALIALPPPGQADLP